MATDQELREAAREAADRMRLTFWGTKLPIDPVRIAKALGIHVLIADTSPRVSGMIRKARGTDPEIVLARRDSQARQRFTCAHELGHFVRRAGDDEFSFVDLRVNENIGSKPDEEIFADEFAGNLLMPASAVTAAFHELQDATKAKPHTFLFMLARTFGVSDAAMRYRLSRLGLLTP